MRYTMGPSTKDSVIYVNALPASPALRLLQERSDRIRFEHYSGLGRWLQSTEEAPELAGRSSGRALYSPAHGGCRLPHDRQPTSTSFAVRCRCVGDRHFPSSPAWRGRERAGRTGVTHGAALDGRRGQARCARGGSQIDVRLRGQHSDADEPRSSGAATSRPS